MTHTIPSTMQAAAIDRFGGIDEIRMQTLPVPEIGPDEVLIRVEAAGVAPWDPFEREGGFAEMTPREPTFPYVLGTDGAGSVAAVGASVNRFDVGDRVYATALASPKGGFYAQYAAVSADLVSHIPEHLSVEQAGVMTSDALTGLVGLDLLDIQTGQLLMIFGAGGGIGHMALQLAGRMNARVFAVASGDDGAALAKRLGADAVVDGRSEDVLAAAQEFAPNGLDAALLTAGGEAADNALQAVRDGGRVAWPDGVMPAPNPRAELSAQNYSLEPVLNRELIEQFHRLIEIPGIAGPFDVHVARTFPLAQAADAQRFLEKHYLGKLALLPTS